ncbi:MAG TPA: hypothetical protein VGP72_00350 [Planctomycetota bacterium]|jgi:hypothetical protein
MALKEQTKEKIKQQLKQVQSIGPEDPRWWTPTHIVRVVRAKKIIENRCVFSRDEATALRVEFKKKYAGTPHTTVIMPFSRKAAAVPTSMAASKQKAKQNIASADEFADDASIAPARVEAVENDDVVASQECWTVDEARQVRKTFKRQHRGAKLRLIIRRF